MTGFAYIITNQGPLFLDTDLKMRFCGLLEKFNKDNTEKCTVF